jgi:hypothetical protein
MPPMDAVPATVQEEIPAAAVGEAPLPEAPPAKANPGHFKRDDPRINRAGRPRGSKKAAEDADPADLAPVTDRLARVFVPWKRLGLAWLASLPADAKLVGARADLTRGGICLMVRSKDFARVARGTVVPEVEGRRPLVGLAVVGGRRELVAHAGGKLGRLHLPAEVVDCLPDETGKPVIVVQDEYLPWVLAGQPLRRVRCGLQWG